MPPHSPHMEERRLFDKLMGERHATILGALNRIEVSLTEDRKVVSEHIADDNRRLGKIERGMVVLQWAYGIGAGLVAGWVAKIMLASKP